MSSTSVNTGALGVQRPTVASTMRQVMLALVPGSVLYAWLVSPVVLFNIAFAIASALAMEWIIEKLRHRPPGSMTGDFSIVLAAWLLALAVPPMLPFWQLLVGVGIMVVLGKHVYGGLGQNLFNPAMVGYAALLVSFPQSMTMWFNDGALLELHLPDLLRVKTAIAAVLPDTPWDSITRATPLEQLRIQRLVSDDPLSISEHGRISGTFMWINAAFLLGGLYLLVKRIIHWHIPVALLAAMSLTQLVCELVWSSPALVLHQSLLSGAAILGAFFIATDPVTTASSNGGRLVFAAGIGSLTVVIRQFGGYPEGLAFAVLLMNLCVPLIDHIAVRRTRS